LLNANLEKKLFTELSLAPEPTVVLGLNENILFVFCLYDGKFSGSTGFRGSSPVRERYVLVGYPRASSLFSSLGGTVAGASI
jgi:hypothetical protein